MDIPNLNERNIQAFDVSRVRPDVAAGTCYLVYAPLSGSFFVADSDGLAALEASAADPRSATGEMASLLERIGDRTLYDELLVDENPVVVKTLRTILACRCFPRCGATSTAPTAIRQRDVPALKSTVPGSTRWSTGLWTTDARNAGNGQYSSRAVANLSCRGRASVALWNVAGNLRRRTD